MKTKTYKNRYKLGDVIGGCVITDYDPEKNIYKVGGYIVAESILTKFLNKK